jgi:hypothetical protein
MIIFPLSDFFFRCTGSGQWLEKITVFVFYPGKQYHANDKKTGERKDRKPGRTGYIDDKGNTFSKVAGGEAPGAESARSYMHQPNQACFFVGCDVMDLLSQLHQQAATKNVPFRPVPAGQEVEPDARIKFPVKWTVRVKRADGRRAASGGTAWMVSP